MEEDFEEVMTIPDNSEINLVRNSDFVENNFVDDSSTLVENKSELVDSAFVEHEPDNVDNNLDLVEHNSINLEHNLDLNESDPALVEHKSDNVEDHSVDVEHTLDVVEHNSENVEHTLDVVEHNQDIVETKPDFDEIYSKNVDNYSDFVDDNNSTERVDTLPARSQTMPNISSFVDVHPNRIENSSQKVLNSVFEDLESPRPQPQKVERRFHKNSTTVASAVNAYSKLNH